jgi:hypothetical protein
VDLSPRADRSTSVLVSELDSVFIFQTRKARKKISAMPPRRRDRKTPDLPEEREMPRRRGRQMPDPSMEREMCDLHARLEDMETTQRRTASARDLSDSESENEVEHEGEEVTTEDVANECLIRVFTRMGAKAKMDIPVYEGNLDVKELLDWLELWTHILTMNMSRKMKRSNMLSQD